MFIPNPPKIKFTHIGFNDWKNALALRKGPKHDKAKYQEDAMKNLGEREAAGGSAVVRSFSAVDANQKQWLFAVFNVTRFLCANGLPFRGTDESSIMTGDGLYLRAFSQLLFPLDPSWEKIHKNLPKNATYTSAQIQNEAISVLAKLAHSRLIKIERRYRGLSVDAWVRMVL